LAVKVLNFS